MPVHYLAVLSGLHISLVVNYLRLYVCVYIYIYIHMLRIREKFCFFSKVSFQGRQLFLGFYKLMEQACQIVFMREETGRYLGLQTEGYWAIMFFIELL